MITVIIKPLAVLEEMPQLVRKGNESKSQQLLFTFWHSFLSPEVKQN